MVYIRIIRIIFAIVLSISLYICASIVSSQRSEIERLKKNEKVLLTDNESYRTELGKSATKVSELEMSLKDAKKYKLIDEKTIKDLKVDIKRLKSINTTLLTNQFILHPIVTKKIIVRDSSRVDTCNAISYKDQWLSVEGTVCNDSSDLKINHSDTITTVVYVIPKKFLFVKYGIKSIEQKVTASSPYTTIEYSRTIKIKRNGKDN